MKRYFVTPPKKGNKTVFDLIRANVSKTDEAAHRLIRQGSVWLGKKRLKDPAAVVTETLQVFAPDFPVEEFTFDPAHVIYEDADMMAVYKPGRINTAPSPFSDTDCLTWGIQKYLAERGHHFHVHAIHRLDQPAQGIVLFAKNKKAETAMHELFRLRRIKKAYLAVTEAFDVNGTRFVFKDRLEWMGKEQQARSFVKYHGNNGPYSLFTASPLTGRTHQLRKHFKRYLRPIVGDGLYGDYPLTEDLMLCSIYYRFQHPTTGRRIQIYYVPEQYRTIAPGFFCGKMGLMEEA